MTASPHRSRVVAFAAMIWLAQPKPPALGRVRAFVESCGGTEIAACLRRRIAAERRSAWVRAVQQLVEHASALRWGCPPDTARIDETWTPSRLVTGDGHTLEVLEMHWELGVHRANHRYHPGARFERRGVMRARVDGQRFVVGVQCTYDDAGQLLRHRAAAGTLDRESPRLSLIGHLLADVRWYDAARLANCGCSLDDRGCASSCDGHEGPWTDIYRQLRPIPPTVEPREGHTVATAGEGVL